MVQAFSAVIALVTAFVAAPLVAWATKGRYDLARRTIRIHVQGRHRRLKASCTVCEREYEGEDMAHCAACQSTICSLCGTPDARCQDQCRPKAHLSAQRAQLLRRLLPRRLWPQLDAGLAPCLLPMTLVTPALGALLALAHRRSRRVLGEQAARFEPTLGQACVSAFLLLWIAAGIVAWWLVLAQRSRAAAQQESTRQTAALQREVESHARSDEALGQARLEAEAARRKTDAASRAKSRHITTIGHELGTPLHSMPGHARLLEEDEAMPAHRRQAVGVIRRGGDHLLSLIEGTLDIARIEGGKLALDMRPMRFDDGMAEIARLFEPQAAGRGLAFRFAVEGTLPAVVRADEKRVRQILIDLLGNAIKFTAHGELALRVAHQHEMARFEITDTGPGMDADELARVFEPFERGRAASGLPVGRTGLGLTIARLLAAPMGGELTVAGTPGVGTTFTVRLFLPEVHGSVPEGAALRRRRIGCAGARRRVLSVDDEEADRRPIADLPQPPGFEIQTTASGEDALDRLRRAPPFDAVFVDLAMPGIDGWETIRHLRAAGHAMPVAVVSANAFDKKLDNDVGLPADDFLVKPVRLDELLDWLDRQLKLK